MGKAAPPRPRSPDWITSSITSSGVICVDGPDGAAIGAAGDGLVDGQRIDRAAIAQDDLLLAAIEIERRTTRERRRAARGPAGYLWTSPVETCSSLRKRPRANSGCRSPPRRRPPAARGSSRASCCRSSPAARRAAPGPAAAPASRSRCSRCGRRRHPARVPRRRSTAAASTARGAHGDAATGRADQDLQPAGIERRPPGGGRLIRSATLRMAGSCELLQDFRQGGRG